MSNDRKNRNAELERRVAEQELTTRFPHLKKGLTLPEGFRPDVPRVLPTFEEAWAKKVKEEGYQYGEDALEQVRFGWDIRVEAERDAQYRMVPKHVTEAISEEDITDADRALVKDFYDNACHAEWCEFDEMMLLYAVVRSRLNAQKR